MNVKAIHVTNHLKHVSILLDLILATALKDIITPMLLIVKVLSKSNCCNFLELLFSLTNIFIIKKIVVIFWTNIFCLSATKIINTDINECESVENPCNNETLKCLNYPGSYNCSYIEGCIFLHLFIVYCLLLLGAGNAYMRRQHINILYPISVFH